MGSLETMGVVLFNVFLILFTLPAYLIAKMFIVTATCMPMGADSWRSRVVLVCTCIAWRTLLWISCWVRIDYEGLREIRSTLGSSGRPAVIVANHSSFLDSILLGSMLSLSKVAHLKMLVSSHIFKMPCLGTICQAMGFVCVPFKHGGSGTFETDKELMAVSQRQLEDHLFEGNVAMWFPEGTMNRINVQDVQKFRAGGFTLAVNKDLEIWCVALQGPSVCWPAKSSVGGKASKVGVRIFRLCESSQSWLKAQGMDITDHNACAICLANSTHDQIQEHVNQLVTDGFGVRQRGTGVTEPLLKA